MNEQELIVKLSESNEKVFLQFYDLYNKELYLFIKKYVHSSEMAQDLTQEVFVKIWENTDKLAEVRSFKSYLYTVAKNHTLNALKKASRSPVVMGEIVEAYFVEDNCVENKMLNKEYQIYLAKAIEELPDRSKEIFRLCREQKKTYEEVASIIGISKNAVKNHMVFSMKKFRKSLEVELGISLPILILFLSTGLSFFSI